MPTSASPASPLRSIVSGAIGNLVAWYDWYVYSAFALYFAPVFFPKASPTAQLLNTRLRAQLAARVLVHGRDAGQGAHVIG